MQIGLTDTYSNISDRYFPDIENEALNFGIIEIIEN